MERDPHVIAPEVARRIRFVGLDVDGVLTDGGIYLGSIGGSGAAEGIGTGGSRFEFKRYEIQDGLGIHFLRKVGIRVAFITGRVSESVRMRAQELEIEDVVQDDKARKLPALLNMLSRYNIDLSDVAFIGDDFPDMAVLKVVGLPVSVANAVPEVRAVSNLRLTRSGGAGAVREFAELLLKARGEWKSVTDAYVAERSRFAPEGKR